jgi:hypothetical protein
MELKHSTRLIVLSLFVAWCFDQLFWKKAPGISFFIFVVLCLVGGGLITWWEGIKPAKTALWLLLPVLFFAAVTFIRQEPFTTAVSVVMVLGAMVVLALSWRGGQWLRYSLSDYVMGGLRLSGSALARPTGVLFKKTAPPVVGEVTPQAAGPSSAAPAAAAIPAATASRRKVLFAVLRGLLLALPVIALLAALLAAADPIFSKALGDFLNFFRIQNLGEYIFRAIYILIGAYLLIGVYLHAAGPSREEKLIGVEKPWLKPFLGWTEAVVVLGCVDVLFAFFVAFQFRYFFGGATNINLAGYTYADYARRGFGELVAVAVISLLLFLGLSAITRRAQGNQRKIFSGLGLGLVALVAAILVSAFQRLVLYEAAYSFTRLRTYTHVFMVWVGILLLATVLVELFGRLRAFALALVLVLVGFAASIALLNVDGFIVRENLARAAALPASAEEVELDTSYLVSLSDDAVPALVEQFQSKTLAPSLHDDIGAVLACRAFMAQRNYKTMPWPAYHWARSQAITLYAQYSTLLAAYPVTWDDRSGPQVRVHGSTQSCQGEQIID